MTDQKWVLKGMYYECCRANGNCPLTFGRDMVDGPCANLAVYQVTEGQVQGVDMNGVVFLIHGDGIGPKFTDMFPGQKGIAEIVSCNCPGCWGTLVRYAREARPGIRARYAMTEILRAFGDDV